MSATTCPRCDRPKQDWAATCWKCFVEDREEAAYERGYVDGKHEQEDPGDIFARGYAQGLQEGQRQALGTLDAKRIRQLVQLCHPDRHGGSEAANDATRWLLDQRKALRGARA